MIISRAASYFAMLVNRDRCSWWATVTVLVGPLRCLPESVSLTTARIIPLERVRAVQKTTTSASCSRLLWTEIPCATK